MAKKGTGKGTGKGNKVKAAYAAYLAADAEWDAIVKPVTEDRSIYRKAKDAWLDAETDWLDAETDWLNAKAAWLDAREESQLEKY